MSRLDWVVLLLTLFATLAYGIKKGGKQSGMGSYLLADRRMPWYIVLMGVMATQASAITFMSAPGQAYTDGMRFVQYYFGLPIAMIVICIVFIPVFRRLNVYTAYEYLERRFDKRTRLLTSFLFLLSRALSTGISIYAPAIILSSILGWNIYLANVVTGGLLMLYTYTGGATAIAHTQKLQFLIILSSMAIAGYMVVHKLPEGAGVSQAFTLAGKAGKLNVITTNFSWKDKYNLWSGTIGGFFLALSYFGTDQSQVGRYITAKDDTESKVGLLLNGLIKIPMQFMILLIGALLFAYYSYYPAPVSFNTRAYSAMQASEPLKSREVEKSYQLLAEDFRSKTVLLLHDQKVSQDSPAVLFAYKTAQKKLDVMRDSISKMLYSKDYSADKNDVNYIFLYFVKNNLPVGLVGLLFAVIILASWGSISAALNSLATASLVDFHLPFRPAEDSNKELAMGRWHTLSWGAFCICVAMFAARSGSLIEAVNVLGSLFYGTILGIFLVAFFLKKAGGKLVFFAALITEAVVLAVFMQDKVSFLWFNAIGALLVPAICLLAYLPSKKGKQGLTDN